MKKIKVLSIFGTRPEAIKMAPLIKILEGSSAIKSVVCVTAQHREMLDGVLASFNIVPDYDLDIMRRDQSICDITNRSLAGLDKVIKAEEPHIVLVHGDTTTAFAGSLAAFYNRVAIGHVEAGLRTEDKYSPFPEEMNRRMIDCIADMYFAPTEHSKANLMRQNVRAEKIFVTGNTVIDAMRSTISEGYRHEVLDWIGDCRFILLTAHRRENLGDPMKEIFLGIRRALEESENVKAVYPMHPSPKVREVARTVFEGCPKIKMIEPLEVRDFHNFQSRAHVILTDSGGVQEEATALGKPVLVLRNTTERPEGVLAGSLKLTGCASKAVYENTMRILTDPAEYAKMSRPSTAYGDGRASERITHAIIDHFAG